MEPHQVHCNSRKFLICAKSHLFCWWNIGAANFVLRSCPCWFPPLIAVDLMVKNNCLSLVCTKDIVRWQHVMNDKLACPCLMIKLHPQTVVFAQWHHVATQSCKNVWRSHCASSKVSMGDPPLLCLINENSSLSNRPQTRDEMQWHCLKKKLSFSDVSPTKQMRFCTNLKVMSIATH